MRAALTHEKDVSMFRFYSESDPPWRAAVLAALSLIVMLLMPTGAFACACGCGVFEVGTSSMFPVGAGGTLFYGLDYQDQTRNWSGGHATPGADNSDKELRTYFNTFGFQYMFNRSWGFQVEIPVWDRIFKTDTNFPNPPPNVVGTQWGSIGDIRIRGIYTGFSDDLSTGITYGIKLPTGNFTYNPAIVDSDSQIGTGSTDILLGAFHRQALTADNLWSWFAQAQLDAPVLIQNQYRPGPELDLAAGVHYNGWTVGDVQITPIAQAIVSLRGRDSGANAASPVASGYQRLILSPGIEFDYKQFSFYGDVEVPVLQSFNGNQLTAPYMVKIIVAYSF
jgi:hypothetical protein